MRNEYGRERSCRKAAFQSGAWHPPGQRANPRANTRVNANPDFWAGTVSRQRGSDRAAGGGRRFDELTPRTFSCNSRPMAPGVLARLPQPDAKMRVTHWFSVSPPMWTGRGKRIIESDESWRNFSHAEDMILSRHDLLTHDGEMGEPLIVSGRGQITLPAALRKRLGLKGGDVVILEDRGNEIVLKPGVVLEVQLYRRRANRRVGRRGCVGGRRTRPVDREARPAGPMRLFLDANVLFTAAHNPGGKAALVIELGARRHWRLFSNPYAFEEARRNLQRKFPDSARMLRPWDGNCTLSSIVQAWNPRKDWQRRTGRSSRLRWPAGPAFC